MIYALRIRSLVWTVEVCEIRSDGVTRVGSRGGQVTDRSWWCGSGWFHTPKSSPLLKRCVGRRSMKRVGDLPRRPEKTQPPSARTTGHNDWNLRLLLLPKAVNKILTRAPAENVPKPKQSQVTPHHEKS